jgi:hypothetical protein
LWAHNWWPTRFQVRWRPASAGTWIQMIKVLEEPEPNSSHNKHTHKQGYCGHYDFHDTSFSSHLLLFQVIDVRFLECLRFRIVWLACIDCTVPADHDVVVLFNKLLRMERRKTAFLEELQSGLVVCVTKIDGDSTLSTLSFFLLSIKRAMRMMQLAPNAERRRKKKQIEDSWAYHDSRDPLTFPSV